ncbi:HDOD domain-containing protein [Actinotalea sp. M2MS4P-6]|uniref:EAL and HDOD domain-containing protein n=1 Tax=Actinotalea sp. M2MS4P-6 TaxID=2983762 RepID=UPI0021E4E76E|nr:HDOD domain-containing protein [Actinotalea sp. M2MS4P-6]MCV2392804.1 HDOD domain-containing protein [Actinotalea sp. M2MS4P-6]
MTTSSVPAPPRTTTRATVHREPVVAVDDRVLGYTVTVTLDDPDLADARARAEVLHEQYLTLDLPALVADRDVFLPATSAMLDGFVPTPPGGSRLVLDLPFGFERREDAERRATALRSLGVQLDLMGFSATPSQMRLLPLVQYVTVDPVILEQELNEVVRTAHAAGVQVLASGVTDVAVQARCLVAGCDGLRGSASDRAKAQAEAQPKVLRPGQLQCLAALHLLHQADVDLSEVAQVIDTDPILTLRVLHLVNSGAFALRNQIDTVHRAVILLGVREVTGLVAALAIDSRAGAMDSLWQILARALSCEALSGDPAAYTVGMLSALVEELGVPADVVLEKVGVSAVVADAVRDQTGELGPVLAAVVAHEDGDLGAVVQAGYRPCDVSDTYLRCLSDALQTAKAVEG